MIRLFFVYCTWIWIGMCIIFCTIFHLLLILHCRNEKYVTDQHISGNNIHNIYIYFFRCVSMRWQRGGNASNNCTVLSQLGAPCEFLGTLSMKQHLKWVGWLFISSFLLSRGLCSVVSSLFCFEIYLALSKENPGFWNIMLCCWVIVLNISKDHRACIFRVLGCFTLKIKASWCFKMPRPTSRTAWRNIPEVVNH